DAELHYASFHRRQGTLTEAHLLTVERLASQGRNRLITREVHRLRGEWELEQKQWMRAAESFGEALRMSHETGQVDGHAETLLAIAKLNMNQLAAPRDD